MTTESTAGDANITSSQSRREEEEDKEVVKAEHVGLRSTAILTKLLKQLFIFIILNQIIMRALVR